MSFGKGDGFLSPAKNIGKDIGKNRSKKLTSNYSQKLIDHAEKVATDAPKPSSKPFIQKTAEATGDLLVIKLLIKLQNFQKIRNKAIHKRLQMSMIKKYLKKNMYLQKKGNKLLMK